MKVWQIMTVFDLQLNSDPSSDIQKSDRHTIFSNIKALYEDALDYALLGKPKAEKEHANTYQNIISIEEVFWSETEAVNMSANPVARKIARQIALPTTAHLITRQMHHQINLGMMNLISFYSV